jgi:hypothetical protein
MKTYLIIFILVLCSTCWLYDSKGPPTGVPIGINKIPEGACGVDKQELMYSDFSITDQKRDSGYITKIDEKSSGDGLDFPWGTAR